MKRLFSVILGLVMTLCLFTPAQAVEIVPATASSTITEIDLGNGITIMKEIVTTQLARTTTSTVEAKNVYTSEKVVIATIAIAATFQHDGKTVSVLTKKVSQKDTYQGWSFTQTSFTSSGGTVRLKGTLKKSGNSSVSVDLSMTCDKNGNIS
jgi:hypothetical protein